MLAKLYGAGAEEQRQLKKLILDAVAGDLDLRSKRELIEKFIEQNLPAVGSAAEIPDSFEVFLEKARLAAFDRLCKEEQLDAGKLQKVIDRYVYTGEAPLSDPDIIGTVHATAEAGGARADAQAGPGKGGGVRDHVYPGHRGVMDDQITRSGANRPSRPAAICGH